MPASKIRRVDTYPIGWFAALRAALAQPDQWHFMAEHQAGGPGGTAKCFGNRLRTLPGALAAQPGFEPALSAALQHGKFVIRQFPAPDLPGLTIFRVRYQLVPDYASIIENALAGVDSRGTAR